MAPAVGFRHAPFSKFFFSVAFFFGFVVRSVFPDANLSFDLPRILSKGEVWRIFTCHLGFASLPQSLVGLILLYQFRQLERQIGPRKFAVFVLFALFINTSVQAALSLTLASPPGPFAIIYGLFPLFYEYIPRLHPGYSLGGIVLSEKSWTYVLGLQLMLSEGLSSIIPAIGGIVAGLLYMSDGLSLQSMRLPRTVEPYFAAVGRVLDPPPAAPRSPLQEAQRRRAQQAVQLQAALAGLGVGGYGAMPTAQPPPEEAIETLMGMGFDRERVIRALQASNNNVEVAANFLLTGR